MKNRNNILISDAVDLLQLRVDESISFFRTIELYPWFIEGRNIFFVFFPELSKMALYRTIEETDRCLLSSVIIVNRRGYNIYIAKILKSDVKLGSDVNINFFWSIFDVIYTKRAHTYCIVDGV